MKNVFIIAAIFASTHLHAQQNEGAKDKTTLNPIATDRPDQTESPVLVPQGWFQIEMGTFTERVTPYSNLKPVEQLYNTVAPTILTKYGVNKNFELRLITDFSIDHAQFKTRNASGVPPITVGFKAKLLEEKGWLPNTSVICHLGLNKVEFGDYTTNSPAPSYRFLMTHTITDNFSLAYNLGSEWSGNDEVATFIYTLSGAYAFNNKLGGFVELYGFAPAPDLQDHRFDCGITYLFNNNQQLDVSGGVGLSNISPAYFLSAGYSFRFKR
jgi:hypothetical protein